MSDLFFLLGAWGLWLAFLVFVVLIALYVVMSLGTYRVLKICGHGSPWMAWIPYAAYWAVGDCATKDEIDGSLFGKVDVPAILFKVWWILTLVISLLGLGRLGTVLILAIQTIFLGTVYGKLYAKVEGKTYEECQVIGFVSGFIPLIAAFKFLSYDSNMRVADESEGEQTAEDM